MLTQGRLGPDRRVAGRRRARHLGRSEPSQGATSRTGHKKQKSGPWTQVSRLGNPLFNEVIVPIGDKDRWNAVDPIDDKGFAKYVKQPELAKLLPVLYPGAFPNLAAYTKDRADLEAILLTGHPDRESSTGSRTSRPRSRRTCCG